jgi:hypothetical protein
VLGPIKWILSNRALDLMSSKTRADALGRNGATGGLRKLRSGLGTGESDIFLNPTIYVDILGYIGNPVKLRVAAASRRLIEIPAPASGGRDRRTPISTSWDDRKMGRP